MSTDDSIGARIRRLRTERSLTQRNLAEPRYTAAFVSTVESGVRAPSTDALHHFAGRLGVSYDELATGLPEEARVELGLQLATAMQALTAGDLARAARLCSEVEDSGRHLSFDRLTAQARIVRAQCRLTDNDSATAAALFASAEQLLAGEPLPLRVTAIAGRARCLALGGDLRYAVHILESTLEDSRHNSLPDPGALLLLHCGLVRAYTSLGARLSAAKAANEALALTPRVDDPEHIGAMHIAVAGTLISHHELDDAQASLTSAYDALRLAALRTEIGWCHWARGYALARERQLDDAVRELHVARDILKLCGNGRDLAAVQTELAEVQRKRGEYDTSRGLLESAQQALADDPERTILAGIRCQLGQVWREQGRSDRAEACFREALELSEEAGGHGQAPTLRLLGDLLHAQGRLDDAAAAYRRGLTAATAASFP